MEKRPTHFRFPVEELVNALIDVLERHGVITLEDVLRTAETWRQRRTEETAKAFMDEEFEKPAAPAPKVEIPPPPPSKPAKDQRTNRRSSLKLPISIRAHVPDFEITELTETVNVSRSGVYFFSDKPYQWQRDVRVVVPHDRRADAQNIESPATIVRIDQKPGQPMRGIALHMSHLFFKLT